MPLERVNVADRLSSFAAIMPDVIAVACPSRGTVAGVSSYSTCTFHELDADADSLGRGLVDLGVKPGSRLVLLVPPGVEFVKLVFALLRCGGTTVLVDPGMGRKHVVNCIAASKPQGFVAVSRGHAVRMLFRRRFLQARLNVTIGRRWFWGGVTYRQLLSQGRTSTAELPNTRPDDPAAIIFTSGSTGPPKGVLYTHRMLETQVTEIQRQYDLRPGGVDLACFALFGLFNVAMGITTVFPAMDFSRPASAEPRRLLAAANDWRTTQAFASPAVWGKLSCHCERTGDSIATLREIFSCGAPVPAETIRRTLAYVAPPGAKMHTPYGATESLPISTIEASEVLTDTADKTAAGAGVCVGRKFDSVEWRVIRTTDEPITSIDDAAELPLGEIGELIVRGPQVSPSYLLTSQSPRARPERKSRAVPGGVDAASSLAVSDKGLDNLQSANDFAKIPDGATLWHRMGDVGYIDPQCRFWYCGRKTHRVETTDGTYYSECVEAVFNQHPQVRRCALVGVQASQKAFPCLIVELNLPQPQCCRVDPLVRPPLPVWRTLHNELLRLATSSPITAHIKTFLWHPSLPVDVRHNAKINRDVLAVWATQQLKMQGHPPC